MRDAIAQHGIRNALLTSVAPTGTISLFADNVSSGIEPVFSFRYTRNVLMPDGTRREEEVTRLRLSPVPPAQGRDRAAARLFRRCADADAARITSSCRRRCRSYIDSSISKTINVPADIPFDHFKDIYLQAYALGCKGCTTYRPNEVTGAVLEARAGDERRAARAASRRNCRCRRPAGRTPKPADVYEAGGVVYMTQPLIRPEALPGQTYKIRWPDSEHALYITLNDIVQDGRRRPFEMFINSKNMEHYAWTVALTRMISAVFRRGGDVSFVVEEMKAVFDPRGGAWMDGRYVPSLLAAIGDVIERHMIEIGFLPPPPRDAAAHGAIVNLAAAGSARSADHDPARAWRNARNAAKRR